MQRSNPFLEMADLVVGETTCDGKKKMYELMAESRPMYVLELPQKADDPEPWQHWVARIAEVPRLPRAAVGTWRSPTTGSAQAIGVMNRERALRRELAALMQADPRP